MEEFVSGDKRTMSISDEGKDWFDQERFKSRMTRFFESIDDFWDEYEHLKKYSPRQKE